MASPIAMPWQRRIRRPWRRSVVVRGMPGRLRLGGRRALGACLLGVPFDPLAAGRIRAVRAARRRCRGRPVRGAAAGGRARGLRQSGGAARACSCVNGTAAPVRLGCLPTPTAAALGRLVRPGCPSPASASAPPRAPDRDPDPEAVVR